MAERGVVFNPNAAQRISRVTRETERTPNHPARVLRPPTPMGAEWMEGVLDADLTACGTATLSRWWVETEDATGGDSHTLVDSGDNFTVTDLWGRHGNAGDWCFAERINGRWQPTPMPGCDGVDGESGPGVTPGDTSAASAGVVQVCDITNIITVVDSVCCTDCGGALEDSAGAGCACGAVGIKVCKSTIEFPFNVKRCRLECEDAAADDCATSARPGGPISVDEATTECCAGDIIPNTLQATFGATGGLNNQVVTLTYSDGSWEFLGTICSSEWDVALTCSLVSSDPDVYEWSWLSDGDCSVDSTTALSATCSPLSLFFNGLVMNVKPFTCGSCGSEDGVYTVTVTK